MATIKQITNFDLKNISPVTKEVTIAGAEGIKQNIPYKEITQEMFGSSVEKLGYICEPKGIIYPIILTINNIEQEVQIGKTGIFEFQPETWKDVNNEKSEEETAIVYVSSVFVPADIQFTLDFSYLLFT